MSSDDLDQLARWRSLGARHSEQVVELAPRVLKSSSLGEHEWAIREQYAIAALDLGKIKDATEQLNKLDKRFPKSPRVDVLRGLRFEAQGEVSKAREVYKVLLDEDKTNISAHQRFITLSPDSASTITALLSYLDIFYSDPQGWSFLAELYADAGMYGQSLTALGHVMVLQVWDSHVVRRAGETAYTMGDYQLALKYFLRATEMETDPSDAGPSTKTIKTRSWWGVKMSTNRLLSATRLESAVPENMETTREQLEALNELATERLLSSGGAGMSVRRKVLAEKTR